MKSERKFEYQKRKIRQMEEEIGCLKAENLVLKKENEALKRYDETSRKTLKELETKCSQLREECLAAITDATETKKKYECLIEKCIAAKKEYAKKATKLINSMSMRAR